MLTLITFLFSCATFSAIFYMIKDHDKQLLKPTAILLGITVLGICSMLVVKGAQTYVVDMVFQSHEVDYSESDTKNIEVYALTTNDGTEKITHFYTLDVQFGTTGERFIKKTISSDVTEPIVYGKITKNTDLGEALNLFTYTPNWYEIVLPESCESFTRVN